MTIRLLSYALCGVAALSLPGCPSTDDPAPQGGSGGETEASSTGAETGSSTGSADTDPLPNDCSCYDPAVDVELDFDEACLDRQDALPGCSDEAPPCDPILEGDDASGGDPSVGPEDAVRCVAERLAQGERPPFVVDFETYNGGESTEYVPLADGRYVTFRCGLLDNPPSYQSVRTYDVADTDHFLACVDDNPDDVQALYDCVRAGFTDADAPMDACE